MTRTQINQTEKTLELKVEAVYWL